MDVLAHPDTQPGSLSYPSSIILDPDFRSLLPQPSAVERQHLLIALETDGCREPIVVWPYKGLAFLLIGYEVYPLLREYRIPFRVVEKKLPDRHAARMYIIKYHLARKNLAPLWSSYLRGLRYLDEKQPHGGRRSVKFGWKTGEALAEIFGVDAATIRRDGALAAAVNRIGETCGAEVKPLLLGPAAGLTREAILDLAEVELERQRQLLAELKVFGKLSRTWRSNGRKLTITVPLEPQAMAETLLKRLGREKVEVLEKILHEITVQQNLPVASPNAENAGLSEESNGLQGTTL